MSKPSFVYVIYIQTTPETLWSALLDPEMTKEYWGPASQCVGVESRLRVAS